MLKYSHIIIKIKLFYYKLIGVIKKDLHKIEIKESNYIPKNVLIIFPIEESSFRVALYTFRNFESNNNTNYYYLINRIHNSHFHLRGEIYNVNYMNNKQTLDDYEKFNKISNMDLDMVIDLNDDFYYDLALIINNLNANFKVGIRKDFSDLFYNLQFDLHESDILENAYEKIKSMLN